MDERKNALKLDGTPQKHKPEVNLASTGSRKLVLGWEGIFLHDLTIHKEGRKKNV